MTTLIEQDALIVIAEVSVAIAGFAGIIAAVNKPSDSFARMAFANVVFGAIGVVLQSLLPILLAFSGLRDEWVWRVASAVFVLGVVIAYIANRNEIVQSTEGHRSEWVFIAADVIVALWLAGAVLGHPAPNYSFVYLGALYWYLVVSFRYFFVSISSLRAGDN